MFCNICKRPTEYTSSRYQFELFLDGMNYENVCLLCNQFVQRYYGPNSEIGILTGRLADVEFIAGMGWTLEEVQNSLECIKKLTDNFLVDSHQSILASLVFDKVQILDLGSRRLRPSEFDQDDCNLSESSPLQSN